MTDITVGSPEVSHGGERFRDAGVSLLRVNESLSKKTSVYLALVVLAAGSCSKKDSSPKEKVLYQTSFDKDDGYWSLDSYDSITVTITGGNYQIENHKYNYLWEELTQPVFDTLDDHIAIEMRFSMTRDSEANYGGGGLLWNTSDGGNVAYFFDICTDGY